MKIGTLSLGAFALFGCAYHPTNINRSFTLSPGQGGSLSSTTSYAPYSYQERSTRKFLFIGNSFTYYNDLPSLMVTLGEECGLTLSATMFAVGSQELVQSANINNALGAQIRAEIEAHHDYTDIVFQEQSTLPLDAATLFKQGARALRELITPLEPEASFHFYATWGYEALAAAHSVSIPECEQSLRSSIETTAQSLGMDVAEVGKAFSYVYANHSTINLYNTSDKKHPSFAGTYLSALVQLGTYTHADLTKITYHGKEGTSNEYGETFIPEVDAGVLRDVAQKVVSNLI